MRSATEKPMSDEVAGDSVEHAGDDPGGHTAGHTAGDTGAHTGEHMGGFSSSFSTEESFWLLVAGNG